MSTESSSRRSRIAWTTSILLNGILFFVLWQNPALRQKVIEIIPKDQESLKENAELREKIEERIETRKDAVHLDESVKKQITERLEQEKKFRALEKIEELKQVYDRMVNERETRIEDYVDQRANKEVTGAVEEVQTALMETARRNELLAERLVSNAENATDPDAASAIRDQADALSVIANEARSQADAIQAHPEEGVTAELRELSETAASTLVEAAADAADLITKTRAAAAADAVAQLATALAKLEKAAPSEAARQIAEASVPEVPVLTSPTQQIAETGQADTLEEVWHAAVEIEQAINAAYDQARAAELAKVADVDLAEATDRVLPTRNPQRVNPFDTHSLTETGEVEAEMNLAKNTAAMNEAERQVGEMAQMAVHRAAVAEGLLRTQERELNAATMFARQDLQKAAFSVSKFSDLSTLMREALQGQGSLDPDDKDGEAGQPRRADAAPLRRREQLVDGAVANALPGRRFSADSPRQGWLYLDTWYVIGPWTNLDITSFQPEHPPEQEIDLDAVYAGSVYSQSDAVRDSRYHVDRGYEVGQPRMLRWQFTQSDGARVIVPDERQNSTYYAYTDVYFEQPQEMLVAVGTDDSGRVWINGQPVSEDKGLSPWAIDETVRKVWFQQGYNEILVRLENGPKDAELSFLICPPDALR